MQWLPTILSSIAGLITAGAYVPYARDILQGRVQPARATRILFVLLLTIVLLQQRSAGANLTLAVTIGELLGSVAILGLSLKHGADGLSRLDKICYILVAIDVIIWQTTGNTLLAICLSVLADTIAFVPTLYKTWRRPDSETAVFYIAGIIGPLLNLAAGGNLNLQIILYPASLAVANIVEVLLIHRPTFDQITSLRNIKRGE